MALEEQEHKGPEAGVTHPQQRGHTAQQGTARRDITAGAETLGFEILIGKNNIKYLIHNFILITC